MTTRFRVVVVTFVLLLGTAYSTSAECIWPSPAPTLGDWLKLYPEVFIAHVVEVDDHVSGPGFRVMFSNLERINGHGPNAATRFEYEDQLAGWPFARGQDRVVFASPDANGLWDISCAPTYEPRDRRVVDALRALRDHRPGGAVNAYVRWEASPEYSRHIVIRQGSRVLTSGDTGNRWSIELGWVPPGDYVVDVTDQRGGRITRPLTIKNECVTIEIGR